MNDLLGRLQRSLLDVTINQNQSLLATAKTLAEHIEGQIVDLKEDFESATKIETSITPPHQKSHHYFNLFWCQPKLMMGQYH